MPSTLHFKFNINLDDIVESRGRFFPSEYADITSEKGEWKLMPEPTLDPDRTDNWKLASVGAQDQNGNLWGLEIRVHDWLLSDPDVTPVSVNENVDEYSYWVYTTKVEPKKSIHAKSLGYSIKTCSSFIVRDVDGAILKEKTRSRRRLEGVHLFDGNIARLAIRENSFIIEMVVEDDALGTSIFNLPKSKLVRHALELLDSGEDADVFFQVNGVCLPAHKLILKMNAKQLYSFFTSDDTTVIIEGTTPELFKLMLRYVYGDDEPEFEYLAKHYQEIIEITDKYNIIGLKLAAQAAKISSHSIDADNVTEILLFAHEKNCFLLKEYTMKMYILNFHELVYTESFNRLATNVESLRELVVTVCCSLAGKVSIRDQTVNELIGKMLEYDLDFDGPKDVLISRLEDYEDV